ncbi:hypothetical protein DFH01_00575 [Falsiroseomonas bella]|uniref:Uncharacterized protein n=1 Tax=Falsiroseomonas bella TaxID=2184016 RepID=A0A317FIF0_9PROT|nr:hypothetical protein [Falsiroseomonas bella]PWS37847.1 hypothetical protein DFH01_00575 [Falsiroseomonas bella]
MRSLSALVLTLPLGGCWIDAAIGPAAVVSGTSVILIGRTPVDAVATLATGRDCSVVNRERRLPWCLEPPAPPPPTPFCTPSLGRVDCWTVPPPGAPLRGVADPPRAPAPPTETGPRRGLDILLGGVSP